MFQNIDNHHKYKNSKIFSSSAPTFVDAFAGCGGLSLGLMEAGWKGLFAIEKDPFAFATLEANFLQDGSKHKYHWPSWLPQVPTSINDVMSPAFASSLQSLRGKVDLLAGGPPCQGFSSAGRRNLNDPRNKLVHAYLKLVECLEPDMVLLENVKGFTYDFNDAGEHNDLTNYSRTLVSALEQNYFVFTRTLRASCYGVPQKRPRFFMIAMKKGIARNFPQNDPFEHIDSRRDSFFNLKGILSTTSTFSAISDLEVTRNGTKLCPESKGFVAIDYRRPRTKFQRLMRVGFNGAPSDTRLARHHPHIVDRFSEIIAHCVENDHLNTTIPKNLREKFGLKKQAIRVLDPANPAPTITSMPDDLIHYCEPRTLTVRENARLQTFPDWFVFRGKFTTGGELRKKEVPRFTQVANAVPPLLAELIGRTMQDYLPVN